MPLEFINNSTAGIHPEGAGLIPLQNTIPPGYISGEAYFIIIIISLAAMACLTVIYFIVRVWGNPILKAAEARTSGNAIIQHFQNSKIGSFLISPLSGGAIRHKKVSDGTLITTPHGINTLGGLKFVNSWNIIGISIPTFLVGGISKLREMGVYSKADLKYVTTPQKNQEEKEIILLDKNENLIKESYNFDDFKDLILKSRNPSFINLQIEFVGDFIKSVNQHYTESIITIETRIATIKHKDGFGATIIITAVAIFMIAIALYILGV